MAEQATRVVAVMTAHRPDPHIVEVVQAVRDQVDAIVVVDNTPAGVPGADAYLTPDDRLTLLANGHNAGLAVALNRGVAAAPDSEFVLFMDQDSVLDAGVVDGLVALMDDDPRIGLAGPAPWDPQEDRYLDPRTRLRDDVADMAVIITSGMLARRSVMEVVGGFREDFFVDCVDQEYCLRVRAAGRRVVQDKRILINHSLGGTRWYGWGPLKFRATHHAAWRIYWVARNTMIMLREHGRRDPRWAVTAVAILVYWAITIALVEPPRLARLRTMLRGVRHGITGRTAPEMFPGRTP
ncbi:glycosyltransferase family 2 protein [Cellulomonas sp. zg-ZUI199]|uniref:Glycosyltransferase family 2 protein n=1 Tax=Cellulomonas wangleii TaxID=2816956 RepID=A0ABX8D2G7_9CELL|nr:glycosyltransferase family 2 protein [Cellulomonas wangleii]MBO0925298.1 glycosyltransferase family 2 protein [Cellulomonas wangleii]QVI61203.1 glycosyltransferase family 2 protein [Cellulomonas wangleii]